MNILLNQPYSFSQIGKRANQEDSRYPDADEPKAAKPFFLVCDGVGGSDKGEVASRTVCDAFGEALSSTDWTKEFTIADFERALDFAFRRLEQISTPENKGMATTLTFAAFHGGGCFIAHIGDSRVYYVRPGSGIVYRTEDHSLVNALVNAGVITPEQAATHPDRNVITRSVCVPDEDQERSAATTVNITDVRKGDCVLLCSDGVLKMLSDDQIAEILSKPVDDSEKCRLIADASRGSDDNNTAYIISVADAAGAIDDVPIVTAEEADTTTHTISAPIRPVDTKKPSSPAKRKKPLSGIVIGAAIGVIAIAVAFFIFKDGFSSKDESRDDENTEQTSDGSLSDLLGDSDEDIVKNPERPAQYNGGASALKSFLEKNIKYPDDAQTKGKQGTVTVELTISSNGEVTKAEVTKKVFPSLDKEAVRVCEMLVFYPALDDGKAVASRTSVTVEFKLPKTAATPAQPKPNSRTQTQPATGGGDSKPGESSPKQKKEEQQTPPKPTQEQESPTPSHSSSSPVIDI